MIFFLQIWGGGCYLTNKIMLAISEGKNIILERQLKLIGWIIYILGVPAWVLILIGNQNWIAASIEAGGLPSMFLGLFTVVKGDVLPNKFFDRFAAFFTYLSLIVGVGYSLIDYKGITSITQLLEIGVMFGFLFGSYFLAKNRRKGWIFFMLMNLSMALLMIIQNKPMLSAQQLISLCFVIYGYVVSNKKNS